MELRINRPVLYASARRSILGGLVRLPPRILMLVTFAGMSITNYAFGFAAGWLLAPGDFGLLAFTQTLLTVTGLVLNSGLPWSLTASLVGANEMDRAKLVRGTGLANLFLSLLIALAILILFALGPLKPGLETWQVAGLVAGTLPLLALIATVRAALQGSERFGALASVWLIETGVKAVSGIGLVLAGFGAAGAVAGFFSGSLLGGLVGGIYLVRSLRISPFGAMQAPALHRAGAMFAALLGMALLLNMDMLALKLFAPGARAEVGRYQAGIILANTPYYMLTATFPVLFTQIVRKKTIRGSVKIVAETLRLAMIVLLPVEVLLALFPRAFLGLLFPTAYLSGAPALRILALGNAAILLVAVLSTAFQAARWAALPGRTLFAITLCEGVLLAVLVPTWRSVGSAALFLAATVTALLVLGSRYLQILRPEDRRAAFRWLGKYILSAGLGIFTGAVLLVLWKNDWLAMVFGGSAYLAGLHWARLVSIKGVLMNIHSIALVGMDGSGKTTQVNCLRETFRRQNKKVVVIHPYGWKILSFLSKPALVEKQHLKHGVENQSQQPDLLKRLAAWLEIADIAIYIWAKTLRCLAQAVFGKQQVWLVSDRSFDDLLVKHQQRKTLSTAAMRVIRGFVPRAETTFWLNTDPTVAMLRDQEFPESYYRELQGYYQAAAKQFEWQVVPTSHCNPEEVFIQILAAIDGKQQGVIGF